MRTPSRTDALIRASLASGNTLTVCVPEGSTAVTVVGYDADKLPVAWTVVVHVVAVEGYTVEEQAWGATTWDAPDDSGPGWALLWECNDYRWLPRTTSDGLVTDANWSFASVTVDSSRERWAYGSPEATGEITVSPTVTFGGDNIYFQTLNTASVGLHRERTLDEEGDPKTVYSAAQPRIAVTYVSLVEWEEAAWSREIEVDDYGTSTAVARLASAEGGHVVYPDYMHHPLIPQPMDHNTVRVRADLGARVPKGMVGTLHLAWYDPDNTLANLPGEPPANNGPGRRDNGEDVVLGAAGNGLPGFTLLFSTEGRSPSSDSIQKAYLAIEDARYGDNFIVAVHPHTGIAETFEFREDATGKLVLMHPINTGQWTVLPDDANPADDPADGVQDHRSSVLTILPSVDIDTDSDNTATPTWHGIDRSDWEEEIENHADWSGKIITINNDDDNGNSASDMDEVDAYGLPTVYAAPDDDLVWALLDFGLPTYAGLDGCTLELTCTAGLRIWGDQLRNVPTGASVYNLAHTLCVWNITTGTTSDPFPPSVYVEGIAPGRQSVTWAIIHPERGLLHSDTIVFSVGLQLVSVDLEAMVPARKHLITRDTGAVYEDVEWMDADLDGNPNRGAGDRCYPVCYTRQGASGDVMVKVDEVRIKMLSNLGATNVAVRATGTIGDEAITLIEPTPATATIAGDYIVATSLESTDRIPAVISHSRIILHWQVSLDGGAWIDAGTSVNTAYITWDDPLVAAPFETCLYIGCKAADGMGGIDGTGDLNALQNIWTRGFVGCDVKRADDMELKYYSPMLTHTTTTAELLLHGNGQCGSWVTLFIDVLKAQGLYTDYTDTSAPRHHNNAIEVAPVAGYADGFIVNKWVFTSDPGISGLSDFPYLNIPDPSVVFERPIDPATNTYAWLYAQVTDEDGVKGQHSPNPESLFALHYVVRVVSRDTSGEVVEMLYDPSYGVTYTDLADMEQKAIAGYWSIRRHHLVDEAAVGIDLNGDGSIENIFRDVFVFRDNDFGGHLIARRYVTL